MFENISNIQNITIGLSIQSNCMKKSFTPPRHVFSITNKGVASYDYGGNIIVTKPNELLFKPAYASYSFEVVSPETYSSTYISFEADIENAAPTVFSVEEFDRLLYISTRMPIEWVIGESYEKYRCISAFYELLSYISQKESSESINSTKFNMIKPAENYLREHIFDSTLSVEHLCDLCGISDTYFRKIFIEKYGESPKKYILNKRLLQAEAILKDRDSLSIKEVSNQVGFVDPLYFSRVFKKKYNVSPTDF